MENFYWPVRISSWLRNLEFTPNYWNPKTQVDTNFAEKLKMYIFLNSFPAQTENELF